MEPLYKLTDTGLAGFIKNLGNELISELSKQGRNINVEQCSRDKQDQGYSLIWIYNNKYYADIMLSREPYGSSNLTIDRFWCIETRETRHFPTELKEAAQIYEDVTKFFEKKFGNPISEHSGRIIYKGNLEVSELVRN